jgi:hypothetical protein
MRTASCSPTSGHLRNRPTPPTRGSILRPRLWCPPPARAGPGPSRGSCDAAWAWGERFRPPPPLRTTRRRRWPARSALLSTQQILSSHAARPQSSEERTDDDPGSAGGRWRELHSGHGANLPVQSTRVVSHGNTSSRPSGLGSRRSGPTPDGAAGCLPRPRGCCRPTARVPGAACDRSEPRLPQAGAYRIRIPSPSASSGRTGLFEEGQPPLDRAAVSRALLPPARGIGGSPARWRRSSRPELVRSTGNAVLVRLTASAAARRSRSSSGMRNEGTNLEPVNPAIDTGSKSGGSYPAGSRYRRSTRVSRQSP